MLKLSLFCTPLKSNYVFTVVSVTLTAMADVDHKKLRGTFDVKRSTNDKHTASD